MLTQPQLSAQSVKALEFDGSSGYVETHLDNLGGYELTLEMWIAPRKLNQQQLFADIHTINSSNRQRIVPLIDANNEIKLYINPFSGYDNATLISSGVTASKDIWYHIAVIVSFDQAVLFVNGILCGGEVFNDNGIYEFGGNERFTICTDYWKSNYAKAVVDDVRLWLGARSEAEITYDMQNGLSGNEPGLALYYSMDEGEGPTVSDHQGNTFPQDGAIFGGVSWVDPQTVFPVELNSFSAQKTGSSVALKWSTATEDGNFGFDVERKTSDAEWAKIGFVAGSGTSNSPKSYNFIDAKPLQGESFYRLKQIDNDGKFTYSDEVKVSFNAISDYKLSQNTPNPFNPSTAIAFELPVNSHVTLKVYDQLGREVATLLNEEKSAGRHSVSWNGRDSRGQSVSSGIYIYRIQAGGFVSTRKMNLLK